MEAVEALSSAMDPAGLGECVRDGCSDGRLESVSGISSNRLLGQDDDASLAWQSVDVRPTHRREQLLHTARQSYTANFTHHGVLAGLSEIWLESRPLRLSYHIAILRNTRDAP